MLNANSQDVISVFVIDSLTNKPIVDAKITDISTKNVIYSGYNGFFKVSTKNQKFKVFKISHLAYNPKTVKIPAGAVNTEIFLSPNNKNINKVVVSASKSRSFERKQALNFSVINKNDNISFNYSSIDDYIQYLSSINIVKPSGIYTNSPIITIAGNGAVSGRTLVLFDGIHLNKSDDGNLNWNMFPAACIESIEILNNPLSSLYGNNAFSGIINFIPKTPIKQGFSGFAKAHYGSFGTYGIEIAPAFKHFGNKGFFFQLDAFAQKSNGYINSPDSLQIQNVTYLPTFMQEAKVNFIFGYDFNRNHKIKIISNYFNDKRSLGIKINEKDGSYIKNNSQFVALKYSASFTKTDFGINLFFQNENYYKNIESLKNSNYSLIYVNSERQDAGANIFLNQKIGNFYSFTSGINFQIGSVYGSDEYQTSSDIITNSGQIMQYEVFLQNTLNLLKNNRIILMFGGNINQINVVSPSFNIQNATSATDFMQDFTGVFDDNLLQNYSFNTAIKINFTNNFNIFASYNTGLNSPTLEDLTRSGFMRFGFKIANPMLEPEKISNISGGFKFQKQKILFSAQINYNQGSNYFHYIETGGTLFGGSKKIIQLQNITDVTIYNTNLNFKFIGKKYNLFANYSFNKSFIEHFELLPVLEGKLLTYNPIHVAHAGFEIKTNYFRASLIANYYSEQFTDDYNLKTIPAYYTFDGNVSADITSNINLSFSIKNILDYQYIIYDNQLSIGRFIQVALKYKF